MTKIPKVSDKELAKWTNILGPEKIIDLFIKNKIHLSSEQLDMVIAIKEKGNDYNASNNKDS